MATEERTQELVRGLYDAVVQMDEDTVSELSKAVVEEGVDAYYAVMHGLTAAMDKVGELYSSGEYFVPELLLSADALYAGLNVLRPHIKLGRDEKKKQVIIGTVEGDIHDIGKNLVRIMFEAAGWVVHDMGKDVTLSKFVEEQTRTHSDVIALSALMTTSMTAMPKVIAMIKAEDPGVAVMVGGAPLTRDIAIHYGADGYADNAGEAVREANEMLERVKK
ncbi:MAG: corrinoid protein [Syntrophorhabdaceae bacterium]|nr:corrinoid protein [Syntrophorhabdaceae bacterium]MDD5242511.1 corrinoid protein [Syntrophorhabdaceae bacterium]